MALTQEYITATFEALQVSCPLLAQLAADSSELQTLRDKIVKYDAELGTAPSADAVCRWAQVFEEQLQAQADAEAADAAREAARQARIDRDFNRPSSEDRAEAEAEFRANRPQPVARQFKPRRNYSDKEIEGMDSETYRREILGDNSRVEDQNRTAAAPPDKTLQDIRNRKIMKDRKSGDGRMRLALRRALLEQKGI